MLIGGTIMERMEYDLRFTTGTIVVEEDGRARLEITTGDRGTWDETRVFVCELRELVLEAT